MIIHVLGRFRMVLHDSLVRVKEKILDVAHLVPGRAAVFQADADMIELHAITGDNKQFIDIPMRDLERSVIPA